MKMTVLSAGLAMPHAGWVAIDELAQLAAATFNAELLASPEQPDTWLRRQLGRARPSFAPVHSDGGDVLFVVARGPQDLALAAAIPDVRRRFARIHGWVTDSYHAAGWLPETALYDAITVTAHEDAALPAQRFGVTVHPTYQGIDSLRWLAPEVARLGADGLAARSRDIDVIAFGRTPPSVHAALARRLHDPAASALYLHSPLGHLAGPGVHQERGMLFKLLQRSRISLAYHLLVEPQGNRPRSMMVTSRWLESLLSGCIVAGRAPVSRMADDMLAWPGATLELPHEPEAAVDALQALLARHPDDHAPQRLRNMAETVRRHDWRWRLDDLCNHFGWTRPQRLRDELDHAARLAHELSQSHIHE